MKIKVAIAGGTGYTAGELIRILLRHPNVQISYVLSSSLSGERVCDVHRDLVGECDLLFSDVSIFNKEGADVDVIFLTLGHGLSKSYLAQLNYNNDCKIIDLGNDFRLDSKFNGEEFVYGLTELFADRIKSAKYIANPGCFATSILLSLAPAKLLNLYNNSVHIHSLTGSTGAGKSPSATTHFSYRTSNISVYKPFSHQHIPEIKMALSNLINQKDGDDTILFVPMRGDFSRGIFTSLYFEKTKDLSLSKIIDHYNDYYKLSPFVFLSQMPISLKEVTNTNKALINIQEYNGYIHITCAIDNLIKGASGQAIQNMNIMFGLDQKSGLDLKANYY